jgi:hypothetical protein
MTEVDSRWRSLKAGEAVRGGAIWGRHSRMLLDSPHPHPRRAHTVSGCESGVCWLGLTSKRVVYIERGRQDGFHLIRACVSSWAGLVRAP